MQLSNNGLQLIKNLEGLRLTAYRDVAGTWTIGYGSTRCHDGKRVKPGDRLANEPQAAALLNNTVGQFEEAVNRLVKVPLTQNQFDALVSFTYNEGTGALEKSALLAELNIQDYAAAAEQFLAWDKITDPDTGHKIVSDTLAARRREESKLFLS